MDRVREPMNWSAIAAEAFELKLGDLARNRKEKTMETVVERLRASKIRRESALEKEGRDLGAKWAKNMAEFDELQRISEINLNEWFSGQPNAPYGWADYLAFGVLGTNIDDADRDASHYFWQRAVGNVRDERLSSEEFLTGFVQGAEGVFRQVEDQI